ncbi:MAG: kelch repeat-containing protein, partial [Myxococcota bacterium]
DGSYTISATARDLAGNPATFSVTDIVLDTTPPPEPDVNTAGRIVYTRIPYGSNQTAGARRFTLEGASGAATDAAEVVAFDGPSVASASRINDAPVANDGSFARFDLVNADRTDVYLVAVDAAGNASDSTPNDTLVTATRVRDVAWLATLEGKEALSTFVNPHRVFDRRSFGPALIQPDDVERSDEGRLGRVDGVTLNVSGTGSWSRFKDFIGPSFNTRVFAAYDGLRGRMLVRSTNSSSETPLWEWRGTTFREAFVLDPEGDGEPDFQLSAESFDSERGVLVLFGGDTGASGNSRVSDTWEFNGESWTLMDAQGPQERANATMAYGAGVSIMFGGLGPSEALGDTWSWDGATWTQINAVGPPARSGARLVYSPDDALFVLYSGSRRLSGSDTDCGAGLTTSPGGTCEYSDLWTFDGTSWQMQCDSDPMTDDCPVEPQPRIVPHLEYDPVNGTVVLFAGLGEADAVLSDLWEWSLATGWQQVTPTDPEGDGNPGGRVDGALAYDPTQGRLLLFLGENEFNPCESDGRNRCTWVWAWDGVSWERIADTDLTQDNPGDR